MQADIWRETTPSLETGVTVGPAEDQSPIQKLPLPRRSGRVIRPPRDSVTMLPPNGDGDFAMTVATLRWLHL